MWSDEQANIINGYRRRHIEQQFAERLTLQQNIAETYKYDSNGQPKSCLFFSDGMTVMKGNTPKKGTRTSKGDHTHITSRIIGVEVHCGPVHGTFLYYTDNLTSGGANIIIEIMKQSVLDLQILLAKHTDYGCRPLDVPDHMILQFDNCPENKNKYVFAYISLLVQEGHFKVVEVLFLIVGHTHASIDQYFSVLARLIWQSHFIGSPLALEYLISKHLDDSNLSGPSWDTGGETKKAKPLLVRKISIVYDLKKALAPLINNKIKYYPIPHRFRFEKYHCVCAMQYSLFSTHKELLPFRPEEVPVDLHNNVETLDCNFDFLSMIGGESNLLESCGASQTQSVVDMSANGSLQVSYVSYCHLITTVNDYSHYHRRCTTHCIALWRSSSKWKSAPLRRW